MLSSTICDCSLRRNRVGTIRFTESEDPGKKGVPYRKEVRGEDTRGGEERREERS